MTADEIVVKLADALQTYLYDQNEFSQEATALALEALQLLGRTLEEKP